VQADLADASFNSASARFSFRVLRPLGHFVKHYDHVIQYFSHFLFETYWSLCWLQRQFHLLPFFCIEHRLFSKRLPASRDRVSHLQTCSASCLSFELADVKDRVKFKTRVVPLVPGCILN
jgi:hypothetical protein